MLNHYIREASGTKTKKEKKLIIMHGLSGTGKSYLSKFISENLPAIRIRSDIERQRIFCYLLQIKKSFTGENQIKHKQNIPIDISSPYDRKLTLWLFKEFIPSLVRSNLSCGLTTIVDATFLRKEERACMINIAKNLSIDFQIIQCECSEETAKYRINKRIYENNDPSEATFDIRQKQKSWLENLTRSEVENTIYYNEEVSPSEVLLQI